MREKYEEFYRIYLEMAEKGTWETEDELRNLINTARDFNHQLHGMVFLMNRCGEISNDEEISEMQRITSDFSASRLYGAFLIENGEIFVERDRC